MRGLKTSRSTNPCDMWLCERMEEWEEKIKECTKNNSRMKLMHQNKKQT